MRASSEHGGTDGSLVSPSDDAIRVRSSAAPPTQPPVYSMYQAEIVIRRNNAEYFWWRLLSMKRIRPGVCRRSLRPTNVGYAPPPSVGFSAGFPTGPRLSTCFREMPGSATGGHLSGAGSRHSRHSALRRARSEVLLTISHLASILAGWLITGNFGRRRARTIASSKKLALAESRRRSTILAVRRPSRHSARRSRRPAVR